MKRCMQNEKRFTHVENIKLTVFYFFQCVEMFSYKQYYNNSWAGYKDVTKQLQVKDVLSRSIAVDCPALEVSDDTSVTGDPNFDEVTILACPEGYDFHLEEHKTDRDLDLTCMMGTWYIGDKKLPTIPECRGMIIVFFPSIK